MNIVFCTDNWYEQIETSIVSILENKEKEMHCHFYLLTTSISMEQEMRYNDIVSYYPNCDFKVYIVDKTLLTFLPIIDDEFGMHESLDQMLPDSAYYRWLIPYYLPNEVEKCLYVDGDVIANRDITHLYMEKTLSVLDDETSICGGDNHIEGDDDIVSGLFFINVKYWRENDMLTKLSNKVIECFENHTSVDDQVVMNIVTRDSKVKIEEEEFCGLKLEIMTKDLDNYYFLHYCHNYKPWLFDRTWKGMENWFKYNDIKNNYV